MNEKLINSTLIAILKYLVLRYIIIPVYEICMKFHTFFIHPRYKSNTKKKSKKVKWFFNKGYVFRILFYTSLTNIIWYRFKLIMYIHTSYE
jgi:hypothetical protein